MVQRILVRSIVMARFKRGGGGGGGGPWRAPGRSARAARRVWRARRQRRGATPRGAPRSRGPSMPSARFPPPQGEGFLQRSRRWLVIRRGPPRREAPGNRHRSQLIQPGAILRWSRAGQEADLGRTVADRSRLRELVVAALQDGRAARGEASGHRGRQQLAVFGHAVRVRGPGRVRVGCLAPQALAMTSPGKLSGKVTST